MFILAFSLAVFADRLCDSILDSFYRTGLLLQQWRQQSFDNKINLWLDLEKEYNCTVMNISKLLSKLDNTSEQLPHRCAGKYMLSTYFCHHNVTMPIHNCNQVTMLPSSRQCKRS